MGEFMSQIIFNADGTSPFGPQYDKTTPVTPRAHFLHGMSQTDYTGGLAFLGSGDVKKESVKGK